MKTFLALAAFVALGMPLANAAESYHGSRFLDVWTAASDQAYERLPEETVTLGSFYRLFTDRLRQSSNRTLDDRRDVLPHFRKLLHPNGICLAGTWNITEATPFTGYFRKGSKGLIILRASTALSEIYRGERRAFGLAGKIFPTTNPTHTNPLKTANFFLIDNLGGTYTENFLDTELTNDITFIKPGLESLPNAPILAAAVKAFTLAEPVLGNVLTLRQLYEISELGESGQAITPRYMKIQGAPGIRSAFPDFRDDLRISSNNGPYRLDIFIANKGLLALPKEWHKIGYIEVKQAETADGCDHRLHFHHPNWRNDLRYE